jgi:hypothetical protein
MHYRALPNLRLTPDIQKQEAISALDTLQNLMYLIRIDAADPGRVRSYVDQAEMVIKMQQIMWADRSPLM